MVGGSNSGGSVALWSDRCALRLIRSSGLSIWEKTSKVLELLAGILLDIYKVGMASSQMGLMIERQF